MYNHLIQKLILIFLLTYITQSCLKNSSKMSNTNDDYKMVTMTNYAYTYTSDQNNNYICVYKCSYQANTSTIQLHEKDCKEYYIKESDAKQDSQIIDWIKNPTEFYKQSFESMLGNSVNKNYVKYSTDITIAYNLLNLKLQEDHTGLCKLENFQHLKTEDGITVFSINEPVSTLLSSMSFVKNIDATWSEYNSNRNNETISFLYNNKEHFFINKTFSESQKSIKKTYQDAINYCNISNINRLIYDYMLSDFLEKYDNNLTLFTTQEDCLWKTATTCYSLLGDFEVPSLEKDKNQFLCRIEVRHFLETAKFLVEEE